MENMKSGPKPKSLAERFWPKVPRGDGCWNWTGSMKPNGYGTIGYDTKGTSRYAHRVAWELTHGPIPAGMNVCHRCDNRRCVRPEHLFLGTQSENIKDAFAKGRGFSAFRDPAVLQRAVEKGNETRRKLTGLSLLLTGEQIESVRHWLSLGFSQDHTAARFGVSQAMISRIKRGLLIGGRADKR